MYIRIFIAGRLSVTEILLISFFILFSFLSFFFTCNDALISCHLCVCPHVCLFVCLFASVFGLFPSIGCLVEIVKIIIHSCLERFGMYGVTRFPLKSYIRTKSKWVKNKQKKKRYKSNQEDQTKQKCLCILILNWKKRVSPSWIQL